MSVTAETVKQNKNREQQRYAVGGGQAPQRSAARLNRRGRIGIGPRTCRAARKACWCVVKAWQGKAWQGKAWQGKVRAGWLWLPMRAVMASLPERRDPSLKPFPAPGKGLKATSRHLLSHLPKPDKSPQPKLGFKSSPLNLGPASTTSDLRSNIWATTRGAGRGRGSTHFAFPIPYSVHTKPAARPTTEYGQIPAQQLESASAQPKSPKRQALRSRIRNNPQKAPQWATPAAA